MVVVAIVTMAIPWVLQFLQFSMGWHGSWLAPITIPATKGPIVLTVLSILATNILIVLTVVFAIVTMAIACSMGVPFSAILHGPALQLAGPNYNPSIDGPNRANGCFHPSNEGPDCADGG
jgi:hypothetical protein